MKREGLDVGNGVLKIGGGEIVVEMGFVDSGHEIVVAEMGFIVGGNCFIVG
jgi:hypothetical protein